MAKLVYMTNTSLDGYIEDANGAFDWADPQETHRFITDLVRPTGTILCGRRIYETMSYWESPVESYAPEWRDFATVWQALQKVVFSRTLESVATPKTRIERNFDPEAIRTLKRELDRDITIGGAELAGHAFEAGLVDECHLFLHPVIVGTGKPAFRADLHRNLELLSTDHFRSGVVHVHYRVLDTPAWKANAARFSSKRKMY